MHFSFWVSHCISGFLFYRSHWHPPAPGNSVFLCCAAPLGPSPVLADLDKENLPPTSTPCLCSQPFLHLLVPQLQGAPFAINLLLQGSRAKGGCVPLKAIKRVQPASIKGVGECKAGRNWLPALILWQGCCCQHPPAALLGASMLWGSVLMHSESFSAAEDTNFPVQFPWPWFPVWVQHKSLSACTGPLIPVWSHCHLCYI